MPAFKVGKYVVTNAQYVRFVQATQRDWVSSDADAPELRNHPARYMSWHDAVAYCAWQTNEWQQTGRIAANEAVTLPSEAEWERAARSVDGRDFPWGAWSEDHANIRESGIGDTSAVGLFPKGKSEDGCLDMAGNVWEWTRSLWGNDFMKPDFKYPYKVDDKKREDLHAGDDVLRVLRGGSWTYSDGVARCSYRLGDLPDGRDGRLGFRVVVRSTPVGGRP